MSTLYNFLCWTTHIDIDSSYTISFYDFCSFSKHQGVFSEYLDNQWIFICIVSECSSLEFFRMNESICWIKFRKHNRSGSYFFDDLPVWTIRISIHRSEGTNGSSRCEIRPERIHTPFIFKNSQKSNFSTIKYIVKYIYLSRQYYFLAFFQVVCYHYF